ncbi:MAG: four helix bundle protein [Prevotella sp.]|nr:four helix bundle protein [Prevotella sp.]
MSIISDKAALFTKRLIKMVDYLQSKRIDKKGRGMLDQVFRSGTSIGANVAEAQFAQSRLDFISKMSIALKEANETENWLTTLHDAKYLTNEEYDSIFHDNDEIISILVKIVKTAKENELKATQDKKSNAFKNDTINNPITYLRIYRKYISNPIARA